MSVKLRDQTKCYNLMSVYVISMINARFIKHDIL